MNCEDIIFQINNAINTAVKMQVVSVGIELSKFLIHMFIHW